jgi:hypothetical protein
MKKQDSIAIYALTRGYSGFKRIKYLDLIVRNICISRAAKFKYDLILFHEGNIKKIDRQIIKILSVRKIQFINVIDDFKPHKNVSIDLKHNFTLSYSLMCQFQYYHVWKYLKNYSFAMRIDEDCKVKKLSKSLSSQILECGAISNETHSMTNETLPQALKAINFDKFYDQNFPYTNVFLTKIDFWLRDDVQKFLYYIYSHHNSLKFRWGDLPVIGIALKGFGNWEAQKAVNKDFSYSHTSHNNTVKFGRILTWFC